jgi:DNA replication protein DnaC
MIDTAHSIDHYARLLRLPTVRAEYERLAKESAKENRSYEQFLEQLMALEVQGRLERRKKERVARAGFPYKKYLQDLQREELPADAQAKIGQIERLDFIAEGNNIILAGNPGTGKTHIAIGLAMKACQEDFSVLFTNTPQLVTQIREARSARVLTTLEKRFENYDLVVCDEFGYISFDKEASEMLFSHLSIRTGRKSTIITTNLGFDRWDEIFGDKVLTAAMVDRITHKAILINMNGESFRMKETKKINLINSL